MRLGTICFATAAMFMQAAGSTANGATANSEYTNVHTVEVISILGEDITMRTHGPTVFGNAEYMLHTDWNVDGLVTQAIRSALGSQFEVKTNPEHISAFLGMAALDRAEIRRKLATLTGDDRPDAYIIVTPSTFATPAESFTGLIVERAAGLLGHDDISMGAYYQIGIFDARTGGEIDYGTSQWPTRRTLTGHEPPTASACSNDIWADTAEKLTDAQRARIRQEMFSLITRSISYTLMSAGLLDRKAADAAAALVVVKGEPTCHESS